jgi:hypothetical protein
MVLGNLTLGCKARFKDPPIKAAFENTARLGPGNSEASFSVNKQAYLYGVLCTMLKYST